MQLVGLNGPSAPGVYHGNINYESGSDDLIDGAQLLPYPVLSVSPSLSPNRHKVNEPSLPLSMIFTEFHFVLLYRDRVMAVSILNEQVVYEDILPLVSNYNHTASFMALNLYLETERSSSRYHCGPYTQDVLGIYRSEYL